MSALLDFREPLEVAPSERRLTSASPEALDVAFDVPELDPGRHCVLVAVTEEPRVVVEDELPSHGTVTLYELGVGSSRHDHCRARSHTGSAPSGMPELGGGCADPVISIDERDVFLDRSVAAGTPLWLFAPGCRAIASSRSWSTASSQVPARLLRR